MRNKTIAGIGVLAVSVALAGCSGGKSTSAAAPQQNVGQTTAAAGAAGASPGGHEAPPGGPSQAATLDGEGPQSTSTGALSSPGSSASSKTPAAQAKPVSAMLAHIATQVTTANMPKARPEWIAAVQKTDDLDKNIAGELPLNLIALVDEAAKTSDLGALLKMCSMCDTATLRQRLVAKDNSGLTGFQELSRVLEQTHPASSRTPATGWDFPGFTRPEKGAATKLDKKDMALLGAAGKTYAGVRAQFVNLSAGSSPFYGWTGFGDAGT